MPAGCTEVCTRRGEIAHCTLELNGTPCRCGKRGCLDTIASLNAMEMAREENLGLSSLGAGAGVRRFGGGYPHPAPCRHGWDWLSPS
ncbi:ROK family protein [Rouxiella badensis]|uniref:ROK family protein n=1 Tax=Rouxiella badensis TaxID=1646377 RepID=UPI0021F0D80D|nr:ROK family protein [Rouxiella badensis]